jgi:2-polyprenyl-3-methyl-5-hydroxy-6-metoxy-1,4-benzoquinol methylase
LSISGFDFGHIWQHYADAVAEPQLRRAQRDLADSFPPGVLEGATVLDLGCGAGLQGWAALEKGARRVLSVDVDPGCVAAAESLRKRSGREAAGWEIREGSALDGTFMNSLGDFDLVLALGSPAHSGDWAAFLRQAARRVLPGGWLLCSMAQVTPPVAKKILKGKETFRKSNPTVQKLLVRLAVLKRQAAQLRRGKPVRRGARHLHRL